MCGIVGAINLRGESVDEELLLRQAATLRHRGPDDMGIMVDGAVGLAHRRLSIIDLSPAGRQPMANEDETLWLVANGEIYNYKELRPELEALGHRFRSQSDSEVILHAYEAWGAECLQRFNGMWAFALWDRRRRCLFAARDRFGVKPFYYRYDGQRFRFASEIKALTADPAVPKRPNDRTIWRYLVGGYGFTDTSEETFFDGIQQLPPAHYLVCSDEEFAIRRYWDVTPGSPPAGGPDDWVAQFRALFEDAVRLRLRSDVPVGACLSGGLDSSSVAVVASRLLLNGRRMETFSACYDDPSADEREFIAPILEATGAEGHLIFPQVDPSLEVIRRMTAFQEEPFSNLNAFAQWCLFEEAQRRGVTVLLNGHGGDELLAGYYPHFTSFFADLARRGRWGLLAAEVNAYAARHGRSRARALGSMLREWGRSATPVSVKRSVRRLDEAVRLAHLDPAFARRYVGADEPARLPRYPSLLQKHLYRGLRVSPLPSWLRIEDRNSMAFSLETRLPFLDYRVAEFLFRLPAEAKIRGGMTKWILRESMAGGVLPEKVRLRVDKRGFRTPAGSWLTGALRPEVERLLASRSLRRLGYLNPAAMRDTFQRQCRGEVDLPLTIWSWVNLALWFEEVMDRPASLVGDGGLDGVAEVVGRGVHRA